LPTRITRKDLHTRITDGDSIVVVEALGAAFYADAHLPGAINIPPGHVDWLAPALVPSRNAAVVVYCTGSCSSADAVARRLEELGYSNVAVYTGGKEDWVEHGLPVERSDDLDAPA
jgi:rhodanese-related sulfurtransferase